MKRTIRTTVAMAVLLTVGMIGRGCEVHTASSAHEVNRRDPDQRLTIVATTAMIGDIVRNVAGDRATVAVLMGANVDPHLFRPTRSDVSRLLQADLVFYNGLNLEGKMTDTFVQIARAGKPVHAVTEVIDESYLLAPEEFEGHFDPHLWMDPRGWIQVTEAVTAVLADVDPDYAEQYRASADQYIAALRAVDDYARQMIATIPSERRVLVTAHDAFNYFSRAYGFEVEAIQGISTDSEAGLRRIEHLVELLVNRRVGAVFTESSVSDQHIRALIEGARARGHDVRIGGELFSDAMGDDESYEGTYIGMIDHNVTTIVRALGGIAPERGLHGKLTGNRGAASTLQD